MTSYTIKSLQGTCHIEKPDSKLWYKIRKHQATTNRRNKNALPAMNQNKIAPVLAQVTQLQNQSLTMLIQ